jgi:sigma-E factor negative regulatory protein RseA
MSEKLKEALSAVIDGEADEFELRRVLDEIVKDSELAQSWERYHLIGSVLRGERLADGSAMRERIWAEFRSSEPAEEDPVIVAEGRPDRAAETGSRRGRWASLAVAASVALAVVVVVGGLPEEDAGSGPSVAAVTAPAQAPVQSVALSSEVKASDRDRVDAYRLYHMQLLGMNQAGFGGFAKMVAYERD